MIVLTYDELEEIVQGVKANLPGYTEKLLEAFHMFIAKYANMLCYGAVDITHPKMRAFIALYIKKRAIRDQLYLYYYKPKVKAAIFTTVNVIKDMLSSFTYEEIINELCIVLLEMAHKYKRIKYPTFHLYVHRAYHLYLKRHIENMVKDPLLRTRWLPYEDALYNNGGNDPNMDPKVEDRIRRHIELNRANIPTITDDDKINLNWINGVTATKAFRNLSVLDRTILKMYYIDKMTDDEVARELGYGARETINRRRNKAKAVLEENVKVYKLLGLRQDNKLCQEEAEEVQRVSGEAKV